MIRLTSSEDINMHNFRKESFFSSMLISKVKLGSDFSFDEYREKIQNIIDRTWQLEYRIDSEKPQLIKLDKKPTVDDLIEVHNRYLPIDEIKNIYNSKQKDKMFYMIFDKDCTMYICVDHVVFDGMGVLKMSNILLGEECSLSLPRLYGSIFVYYYYLFFPYYLFKMLTLPKPSLEMDLPYENPKHIHIEWDVSQIKVIKNKLKISFISVLMAKFFSKIMKVSKNNTLNVAIIGAFSDLGNGANTYSVCVVKITYDSDLEKMAIGINKELYDNKYQFILYPLMSKIKQCLPTFMNPNINIDAIFSAFPTDYDSDVVNYFMSYFFRLSKALYVQALSTNNVIHACVTTRVSKFVDESIYNE